MSNTLFGAIDSQVAPTADIDESALALHSKVGEHCWLAHGAMLCYSELGIMSYLSTRSKAFSCCIGNFSSISWNVSIGPANHDYKRVSSHAMLYAKRFGMLDGCNDRFYDQYDKETSVGNDVWIGCNSVIMRGVHIGDGAVIGANAVITKDVAPYTIVGGVNHLIKQRFNEDIVNKLLEIQWWNYPIEKIKACITLIAQEPSLQLLENLRIALNR